jgi:hypothetical protein
MEWIPKKILIAILSIFILIFFVYKKDKKDQANKEPLYPNTPEIKEFTFGYQDYNEILNKFKKWENESPFLIDVKKYGKEEKYFYIKICNEYDPGKNKILITACIHGNEPLSSSTVIAYAGKLLSSYKKDKNITDIINKSTIYFVPVVSPETYPHSRNIQGVDPNRDFPTLKNPNKTSVELVQCLKELFLEIRPNSVLSGHTFGRVYLIPWGDSTSDNENLEDYKRIASTMGRLSNYRYQRACEMYNRPIYGTEIDWYHRNGSFAMVMEFGTHQKKPSLEDTIKELDRTFEAFLYFLKESPQIKIKNFQGGK